ncbi:polysaccharide biosynthesis/export family protein [Sneathiella litorea]|uniref:Soluble ligand binding domain-containing protein n=1 Tax=Sneathiella litorea TaxID=2606216 RepID=A0A6L8WB12_9PROT|nr:polysaccharide biosynthesis/export family protein [Sneathiella litorea]MZR32406.1 hypothetical protein [Sneathiella litorea]
MVGELTYKTRFLGSKILLLFVLIFTALISGPLMAEEYRLDSGDVLDINLLERSDMSGDVKVGIDGTISLPGVGIVMARGKTLRELENSVRELIANTIVQPSLAIQILEYRPFFVLGEVVEAGQYPFISKLNVLKAVSLAKGFRRNNQDGDPLTRQLSNIRAKQALRNNIVSLASARVRLARLLAEEAGEETFNFEARSEMLANFPDLEKMLIEERELFAKRRDAYEAQVAQVNATISAGKLEVESYKKRSASQDTLSEHIQKEITEVRELRIKGLVPIERLNRLIREQLEIRGRVLDTMSLLRQSQVALSLSEEKLIDLTFGHKAQIAQDIRSLNEQIAILEASIDGEIAIVDNTDDGQLRSSEPDNIGYDFSIYRDGILLDEEINFNTPVLPGDTLIVIRKSSRSDTVQLYND